MWCLRCQVRRSFGRVSSEPAWRSGLAACRPLGLQVAVPQPRRGQGGRCWHEVGVDRRTGLRRGPVEHLGESGARYGRTSAVAVSVSRRFLIIVSPRSGLLLRRRVSSPGSP